MARSKSLLRKNRKYRVRKKMKGSTERPRLSVFRSNKYLYAQVINDDLGVTLTSASTISGEFKERFSLTNVNKESSEKLGELLAEKINALNIKKLCFDKGHYQYHGCLKVLADKVRSTGVDF